MIVRRPAVLLLVAWGLAIAAPALAATPRYVAADAHIDHYELAADRLSRTDELVHASHVSYAVRELWELVVLVIVLRLGVAAALLRWIERRTSRPWLQTLFVASLTLAIVKVGKLPVALAWPMQTAFAVIVGTVIASILYACIRRWPHGWRWRVWLLALPLVVAAPIAGPVLERAGAVRLIDRDPRLVDRIETFAERRGVSIDRDRIFILANPMADAHSTGIGPTRAIFVNEGALDEYTDRELGFLLAHEVGHFYGPAAEVAWLAGMALGIAAALAAVAALVGIAVRRWGVPALASPASLPAALLAIALVSIAVTPIQAIVQRRIEHQADANGLQLLATTDPDAPQLAAHQLQRMGELVGAPPHDSIIDVLFGADHPAVGDRIDFVLGR